MEAAVAADVGVPKIQEGHTPFLLTSDEHSVGPQVRAGWGPRCRESEPPGVDPRGWDRQAPDAGWAGRHPVPRAAAKPSGNRRDPTRAFNHLRGHGGPRKGPGCCQVHT